MGCKNQISLGSTYFYIEQNLSLDPLFDLQEPFSIY